MATTRCAAGVWTDLPVLGVDMVIEAKGSGFYVDLTGNKPASVNYAFLLQGGESMIVTAGETASIRPAQDVLSVVCYWNPLGPDGNVPVYAQPANTVLPAISGTPIVGNQLSCSTGTWTGTDAREYSFFWFRDGVPIFGARHSTYYLQPEDAGLTVSCQVVAYDGTKSIPAMSAGVAITGSVYAPPVNTALPVISGSAVVGNTLGCSTGTWTGSDPRTYSYQWRRNGANISGATSNSYTLVAGDLAATITCRVTANDGTTTAFATSTGVVVSGGAYSEQLVSVANNSLLSSGTAPGSSVSNAMMLLSFTVPTVAASYATVAQFGFGSYVRVTNSYGIDINWGPTQTGYLLGVLKPGMRVNLLVLKDQTVTSKCQFVAKINGGSPITLRNGIPGTGAITLQNVMYIGNSSPSLANDFVGGMARVQVWDNTATFPNITDPAVQANFWNADGTLADPSLSHTYGTPIVEIDGADLIDGTNTGSIGGNFTVTGTITAGWTAPAFIAGISNPVADKFGFGLNQALTAATATYSGYIAWGTDTNLEIRATRRSDGVAALDWTSIGASVNGTFSGSLSIPANDDLLFWEVRDVAQTGTGAQAQSWTTAIRVLMYGQSNTVRAWSLVDVSHDPNSTRTFPNTACFVSVQGPALSWTYVADPGDGAIAMANELSARAGLPVMILGGGLGGKSVQELSPNASPTNAFIYNDLITALTNLGGTLHAMVWHQGESNIGDNFAFYSPDFIDIRDGIAALYGLTAANLPCVLSSLGVNERIVDNPGWDAFRTMQATELPTLPGVHFVAPWTDEVLDDQDHSYGNSYQWRCAREGAKLAFALGLSADPGNMTISAATKPNGTTTVLTISHATGGSDWKLDTVTHHNGAAIEDVSLGTVDCFEVSDDAGATWITATVAYTNATTITLTHADIGTGARLVRYASGIKPLGFVRDTSALKWPLMFEFGMNVT